MLAPQQIIADKPLCPLPVKHSGIPDELKRRPQWVNWKYAWDGKKWTKHPYTPRTGRKASSVDLLTWSQFNEVLWAYETGEYDGLGFVFSSGDPYVGVDLDGCVDTETAEVAVWAMQIIGDLNSYTEFSPSGAGVHIIATGRISCGGRRGPVEMYDSGRFFTMTGHVLEECR